MPEERGKPPRKRRSKPTDGGEPPDASGGGYPDRGHRKGEPVEGHAEFVVRHFGGGAEATPALFDRALEVWQRLPGAVVRGPGQIRPNRPVAPAGDDGENEDAAS